MTSYTMSGAIIPRAHLDENVTNSAVVDPTKNVSIRSVRNSDLSWVINLIPRIYLLMYTTSVNIVHIFKKSVHGRIRLSQRFPIFTLPQKLTFYTMLPSARSLLFL